jgi:hypothetical protein
VVVVVVVVVAVAIAVAAVATAAVGGQYISRSRYRVGGSGAVIDRY